MPTTNAPVVAGVSEDQPSVVRYAMAEASRLDTSVRVVHCYREHAGDVYIGSDRDEPMRAAGEAVLDAARRVVDEADAGQDVEYVLERGDPGSLLLRASEWAQVVVVGADETHWLERMLGGDVSGHLALQAACPVVVVPRELRDADLVDRVVVTLDGDTSASGPLRYGFELADFRTELLHVMHATPAATTAADTSVITARVSEEVALWNELTPAVRVQLSLTNGDSLEECIGATVFASLLVIGRPHGGSPLFALTRPVAMLVLREARCPVAIVPADYGSATSHPRGG